MDEFIKIFAAVTSVLNMLGLIWLAASRYTELKVKVEPMWSWFISNVAKNHESED